MPDHAPNQTEANRTHFNEAASSYNNKFEKTILQIIHEIQDRREWLGVDWVEDASEDESSTSNSKGASRAVRLLDYACGTGSVSRALAPYVSQCVGIDLTEGMAAEYNKSVENQGIPSSEMFARVGNLIDPSDPSPAAFTGPEFHDFDIAAVGLGFHHFDDPALAAKRLAERLKPGGVLFIVDFLPHEHHHHHAAEKSVTHMGFAETDIKRMFEEAGVGKDFDHVVVGKGIVFTDKSEGAKTMTRKVFMARGTKV
ncbi:putative methyltransferase [Lachnellula occidentalis]|uniref:Putative methyltransferase n=1 Tax=Lachnellula occidentalis TaxID=215460 RepID=A0A8H8RYR3_9HELO|nr:putative methyltransferase [Lachnellula occidentalis]